MVMMDEEERKIHREIHKEYMREWVKKNPWAKTFLSITARCNNPKHISYKKYGGRGVKCLITSSDLKKIWFRDMAYKLTRPSIDRIDSNGNYELSNCRYIELSENSRRGGSNARELSKTRGVNS